MTRSALALLGALVLAPAAPAAAERAPSSHCAESGDFCTSVVQRKGVQRITLMTFSLRGRVRTCVTAPDGTTACRRFLLRSRGDGLLGFDARWSAHFPVKGPGRYIVRYEQGFRIGPALAFTRR